MSSEIGSQDPCSAHHAIVAWQHFMLLCIRGNGVTIPVVGKLKEVGDDPAEEECANMVAQWSGQENNQIWTRTFQLKMHQIRS